MTLGALDRMQAGAELMATKTQATVTTCSFLAYSLPCPLTPPSRHLSGRSFSTGDVVQMTVDMDNKTISYAINGSDQGVCHRKISADEVCPVVTLYKQGDQITLI